MTDTVAQDKGLNSKLLPELRAMAADLGIEGASGLRKAELIKEIGAKKSGGRGNRSASRPAGKAKAEASEETTNNSEERTDRTERADRGDRTDRSDRGEREDRGDRDDRNGRGRDRRGRDRDRGNRRERGNRGDNGYDIEINEDDVLLPVGGIVDILDNYAFVRTSGYLPGPNDVYVSMGLVKRFGLRKGDAVTGQVKQPREGDRRRGQARWPARPG